MKLQMTHAGRRPAQLTRIYKRNIEMTNEPDEVKVTCHEHFNRVLNIPSHFQWDILDAMPSCIPDLELDHPPGFDEL